MGRSSRGANPLAGFVVFNVPRATEKPSTVKQFDVSVSSLDCLVELFPDGKVRKA